MNPSSNLAHQEEPSDAEPPFQESEIPHPLNAPLLITWDAAARLKRELIWTMGEERANALIGRWAYSCGMLDAGKSEKEPPLIQNLSRIDEKSFEEKKEEYIFEVKNSLEALSYHRYFGQDAKSSQCWLMTGYLTGFVSATVGRATYFMETTCQAKGDSSCRFVGKSRGAWPPEFDFHLQLLSEDNMGFELAEIREQLRLTKDRYQNLFEQASVPVFILDPGTGAYLDVNMAAEDLTGYTKKELLQKTAFDLRHAKDHHQIVNTMKALNTSHQQIIEDAVLIRKDGTERTVSVSNKILIYGDKKVIQSIMQDVTDLKISEQKEVELQQQLSRSERLSGIGRLAASVAHEIKNPLGAIRNAIYYVKNSLNNNQAALESDPNMMEMLKLAEEEVDGAVTIIGELLDFSRVIEIIPRKTMVNDLLEKLPNIINIPENVALVWDLDITLPSAIVDPDRLTQVFCNITTNAIQAMPEGGLLKIGSRLQVESSPDVGASTDYLIVNIEDTGVGIEPHQIKKIFEPLFTTKVRGTGLGLAISNNIVEKHGGTILATSKKGKGTTFSIKLPLKPPQTEEPNHAAKKDTSR